MTKRLNRAKCKLCGKIIVSRHRHDFVSCDCGAIAVDGGNDYCRHVGSLENILIFKNRRWVSCYQKPKLQLNKCIKESPFRAYILVKEQIKYIINLIKKAILK